MRKITKRCIILGFLLLLVVFLILIIKDNMESTIFGNEDSDKNPGSTSQVQGSGTDSGTGSGTGSPTQTYIIKKTSLTAEEISKVRNAILSSEFIGDLPKDGVISLRFFNFENGQRVWLNTFLIGKNQILTSGTPDIYLTLHYKYLAELTETNLCEIIQTANTKGDLGMETELSNTKLLFKYSGIIKYRDCFGF
jgi:hypothetical protein